MIQRNRAWRFTALRRVTLLASALALAACDRPSPPPASPARSAEAGAIVSLSPAATGLVVAIGTADRLVGVSTFDADPRVAKLPRVGDYENVDWERIRALAPKHLITQVAPERLPAGFVEQAHSIGCWITPIHIDRLDDIRVALDAIGTELGATPAAAETWARINGVFASIRRRVASRPTPRVLIAISDDATSIVGANTFLDDLLRIAGGENAAGPTRVGYPTIDREQLAAIDPDVVLFVIPSASPEQIARATAAVATLPGRTRKAFFITRVDALQPNANVAQTAEAIADDLHGEAK